MVALMLVFLIVGYYAGKLGIRASTGIAKPTMISIALLFIPFFFLVIGIHEAGHALAGIWVKFDFTMYVVGPFMWTKENNQWHFHWNKNVNTAGGLVLCLPTNSEDLPKRFSMYAAGGPIASLLLAMVAYGLFRLFSIDGFPTQNPQQLLAVSCMVIAFLSGVIFLVTAIPMHMGGFSTDGARILRFAKGGESARFEILILTIFTTSTSGARPRLWNEADLTEALTLAQKLQAPMGVYLLGFFHQYAFDRDDFEKAEQYLQEYIAAADEIPAGIRSSVWLDAAFFYAFAKKDLAQSQQYWTMFTPNAMIPKAQIAATEAAIHFLANEKEAMLDKIDICLLQIPNMMDKGLGIALRDRMLALRDKV